MPARHPAGLTLCSMAAVLSEPSAAARRVPRFLTVSLARELGILLTLSVMFPFMVHILPVPEDARLGPRLLPLFYAPLLAALWGRAYSALVIAVAAPWLNWVLTAHPPVPGAMVMTVELSCFVIGLRFLLARGGARWFLAAPAYFFGKVVAMLVVLCFPDLVGGRPALGWTAQGMAMAVPGIAILVLINFLAVHYYPPGSGGGGPKAA